jgi:MFS family permease
MEKGEALPLVRRTVFRLQSCRFIRAIGQGILLVAFSLYLIELGWSPAAVGALFTASGLLTALASWLVGMMSDRKGRRLFLMAYDGATAVVAFLLTWMAQPILLAAACLFVGFGRTQSGRPGLAAPAEQAWLAGGVSRKKRGMLFSVNAALGFFGMAAGSLLTGLVPAIRTWLPGLAAYKPLFLLVGLGAVLNLALLLGAKEFRSIEQNEERPSRGRREEEKHPARPREQSESIQADPADRDPKTRENIIMAKLGLINALNGIAIGLTAPLLVYWFNLKFGVGPGSIGPVFAATYLLTSVSSVVTGKLTQRIGVVKAVVIVRLAAVVMLVVLPLMPTFALAAAIHIVRSATARGSIGARQALAVSLVRESRRGLASSIDSISLILPHAVGPSIAGVFLAAGYLTLPFLMGACTQFVYAILYGATFKRYELSRPDGESPG